MVTAEYKKEYARLTYIDPKLAHEFCNRTQKDKVRPVIYRRKQSERMIGNKFALKDISE